MAVLLLNNDGDEITRYGFISHMEDYMNKLFNDPSTAYPDEYLCSHGLDGETALQALLKKMNPNDDESAVLLRKETIKKNPNGGPEIFSIKYKRPSKDYIKKMRNLYISLFENNINDNPLLNEDGEGGMCGCDACGSIVGAEGSTGEYEGPFLTSMDKKGKKKSDVIRRVIFTEDQIKLIKECECGGEGGMPISFDTYDAPAFAKKKDDAYNHKNIMADSWQGNINEEGNENNGNLSQEPTSKKNYYQLNIFINGLTEKDCEIRIKNTISYFLEQHKLSRDEVIFGKPEITKKDEDSNDPRIKLKYNIFFSTDKKLDKSTFNINVQ